MCSAATDIMHSETQGDKRRIFFLAETKQNKTLDVQPF